MARTHQITSYGGPDKVFTACGMEGWGTAVTAEFETAAGRRFEAVEERAKVTCKNCIWITGKRNQS